MTLDAYIAANVANAKLASKIRMVAADAPVVRSLRLYRAAVAAIPVPKPKGKGKPKTAEPVPWTQVLSADWMMAGPARAQWGGFERADWGPLQALRNGLGFDVFDHLDAIIDGTLTPSEAP